MAKMFTSRTLQNLNKFPITEAGLRFSPRGKGLIRNPGDMFLVWKTIEYFQPKSLLEIGFYGGQSMGLYLEAGSSYDKIVAVDITYRLRSVFDELFPATNIEFIKSDSREIELNEKFDFITIDGDHNYESVNCDLKKCLPLLKHNSILYMDEYSICPGVERTIAENLLGQHDWVPFLAGVQGMFFHHISHSADKFLDEFIQNKADNFLIFRNNLNWNGFTVLFCEAPIIYTDNNQFFIDSLKFYDL
jgi:predicted O-methyltransferase YrrM